MILRFGPLWQTILNLDVKYLEKKKRYKKNVEEIS